MVLYKLESDYALGLTFQGAAKFLAQDIKLYKILFHL